VIDRNWMDMQKAQHYVELEKFGLPVPNWSVGSWMCVSELVCNLELSPEAGGVGIRTEPMKDPSPLGRYPHAIVTRGDIAANQDMFNSMGMGSGFILSKVEAQGHKMWDMKYLVNEYFPYYRFHAVVQLTRLHLQPGRRLVLVGEMNYGNQATMLRDAMKEPHKVREIGTGEATVRGDAAWCLDRVRRLMQGSNCVERYVEVSGVVRGAGQFKDPTLNLSHQVRYENHVKIIFWGFR